ncbi:hypothetical protein [Microbacterium sp. SORGH_AS_0862]|uniref:hypothetical protein n=1 Tax=Microbacterium sp. SORGH_AS_0862 TaxID=3041789 RepID=UPI00278D49F2|nr:hypothetical protein [Microbacterium sp. SORGH_AS_0862]MDQ1206612.1 chromosome segregation ATPase [Microbacterium sp. SORGH_AS_0862]
MGLETIESEIEDLRDQAKNHQEGYARALREIDADTSLSDSGKRDLKTQEFEATKAALSKLRAEEQRLVDAAISRRKAQIEAPGRPAASEIISYRDAQDRAARLKADEAVSVLERALRQSDMVLAHAIFDKALTNHWGSVIDTFTAAKPELRVVVQELKQLNEFSEASLERTMRYLTLQP